MVCPNCNSNPCLCGQMSQSYKLSDEEISQLINEVNMRRQESDQLQIKCMMFEEMAIKYKIDLENMRAGMANYEQKVIEATGTIVTLVNEKAALQAELDALKNQEISAEIVDEPCDE